LRTDQPPHSIQLRVLQPSAVLNRFVRKFRQGSAAVTRDRFEGWIAAQRRVRVTRNRIPTRENDRTMLGHNRRMSGAECLADMLQGYGVTHVFMVPAVLRRTFAEMEKRTKLARIHTHGEKSAAYMADGYARASGKPGICMAQVIGALNLAAGLRAALPPHPPVLPLP